ncbi:MAG: hypothetical protein K2L47_02660, partial [Clostridia bacterium]|nr:hypothetical protein [Clostridia bacterium]
SMKSKNKFKFLSVSVIVVLVICALFLIGCMPFKDAPQGLSEDTRNFTKIKDERMYAEAEDYKGYIYKSGEDAFCFRLNSPNIEDGKNYPMVIFLHGMGDYGSDNSKHMYRSLIDSVAKYAPEDTFVFMPQGIKNWDWSSDSVLTGKGGMDKLYNECLDVLLEKFPIDRSRVYLTGMSMGGHGTIWQVTNYPEKYAALMPVCGWFYYDGSGEKSVNNLDKIVNKPMWFFHSRNDKTVPFNNSTKLVEELESLGATNIKTSWFDEPLHDITSLAYDKEEVWQWLFKQKLN